MSIAGKRALVTGGSSGIGLAIATALAGQGARVAVTARSPRKLEPAAAAIDAIALVADISAPEAAADAVARAIEVLGGLDILVLSSGMHPSGTIAALPDHAFAESLAANVIGPAALARAAAPALVATRGNILVVNSTVVRAQNIAGRSYFAATQHAMRAFADGLRDELNESGVRVTSIYPGATATSRQEELHRISGRPYAPERMLQPADVAEVALAALSMQHTAEMTDVFVRPRYKG